MNPRKKVCAKPYVDNVIIKGKDELQENDEDKVSDGIPGDC